MKANKVERFIEIYSKFYFENTKVTDKEFEDAGIPKYLNRTDSKLENYIEDKIKKGIYDAEAFAWKAGKAEWKNDNFSFKLPLPELWQNGNGGEIKKDKDEEVFSKTDFEEYIKKNCVDISNYKFDSPKDRKELFLEIKEKYELYNYGTVNIINQMFFLSKGAIPLYDYYAHVAVKALFMNKSPLEVCVAEAPQKDAHPKGRKKENKEHYLAINILEEYIWLLKKVFPNEIHKNKDSFFISRRLDQALWVYGHSTNKFEG